MLSNEQTTDFEAQFPTLAADTGLLSRLKTEMQAIRLPSGQTICHEGDSCSSLALVVRGTARVFKLAESGREITLYRIEPGECCILTASCILSGRAFPANATVDGDLLAVLVPESRVVTWMNASQTWRHYLWGLVSTRLGDVIGLVDEVAFRRMDERLAEYLAAHAASKGPLLQATHQQIAAELGTSREVISRLLKDLEQRGLLKLSRGRIELGQPDALRQIGDDPAGN